MDRRWKIRPDDIRPIAFPREMVERMKNDPAVKERLMQRVLDALRNRQGRDDA